MTRRRPSVLISVAALSVGALLAGCSSSGTKSDSSGASGGSGHDSITVTLQDISFAISGKLNKGGTIELKNAGAEMHMMELGKLRAGVTLAQVKAALEKPDPTAEGDPMEKLVEELKWPGTVLSPGQSLTVSAAGLDTGSYAIVCFMPSEVTGVAHFARGMLAQLDVVSGSAVAAPTPDTTYKVTIGKPLDGPATLTAGKHTIAIASDGDASTLQPSLFQARSGQTPDQINDLVNNEFGQLFANEPPPKGLGTKIADFLVFTSDALGTNKTGVFTYDFKPGVYYLAAHPDTNQTETTAPPELIKITVT